MKPYPFTDLQLAWLHDLETTTEPQTVGALHRVVKTRDPHRCVGFCCLGRGAVVLGERPAPWHEDDHLVAFSGSSSQLLHFHRLHLRGSSGELLEWVPDDRTPDTEGYSAAGWDTLAELNDELRWPFAKIAAYCREHPWNVFTDPEAAHADYCPWESGRGVSRCECDFFKRDGGAE